jgi:bifunctional DNA-binding transcriptional regulator/antitoxin component of YhaV-PrlF toxin-antitoxin module
MSEVLFEGGKVQVGGRIKIPKPIIDTLKLKEGQKVILKFNPEKKEILIKEDKKK